MVILGISAFVLLIVALICGTSAANMADADNDGAPAREFAIRQLTAAAWVSLGAAVAMVAVVAVHQMWIAPYMPTPQEPEVIEAPVEETPLSRNQ